MAHEEVLMVVFRERLDGLLEDKVLLEHEMEGKGKS
jgi:hypothetical protein